MHKVLRNEPPKELDEKNIDFNKQTLHSKEEITNAWNSFTRSSLKQKTLEQLNLMFKGCCAYCEGYYRDTSFSHIDHFKPKSIYPNLMFDYNNMNLSCTICNQSKSDIDDDRLINPTIDEPSKHLQYRTYMLYPLDERGRFTIETFKLNSNERTCAKEELYIKIYDGLQIIIKSIERIKNGKEDITQFFIEKVKDTVKKCRIQFENGSEYSTMCKDNFEEIVDEIDSFMKKI